MKPTAALRERLMAVEPVWDVAAPKPTEAPKLYKIVDSDLPAGWVVVFGWMCEEGTLLRGSVVMRGPDSKRYEREPVEMLDHGYSYLTKEFSNRTVTEF